MAACGAHRTQYGPAGWCWLEMGWWADVRLGAVNLSLGHRPTGPSPAEVAEDQRARDPRAELTRRRRPPTGGGTGRECRPTPSAAAAGLARCQAPRLGRSAECR